MVGLQYFECEFFEIVSSFVEGSADMLVDPDGPAEVDDVVADQTLAQVLLYEGLEVEHLR